MTSLVLELAVYHATQYKIASFFKYENRSVTFSECWFYLWALWYSQRGVCAWKLGIAGRGETHHSDLSPISSHL